MTGITAVSEIEGILNELHISAQTSQPRASDQSSPDDILQLQVARLARIDLSGPDLGHEDQRPGHAHVQVTPSESPLTPINELPPEILCAIFTLCVELEDRPSNIHPAFTISHTCSVWRAISLGYPIMWSRV
ncbi:uncharacterized protein PHACADRAFT_260774, partial [Phanerochaete carnosa HHB-10118-sp]